MSSIATKVLANPKAIRRLGHEEVITVTGYQDGYGFAIHPSEVTALSKLSRIQQVITEISEQEVVPVQLVSNILHFQSVSCLLYTSPSPRDQRGSRMPSSA